ncbi:NAD(P)-dependent oxidoreductase [Kribbella sp. NPDC051770]|uniref:NAD(P)-dependent oxidoreductase n=1 Tax=Kribbella sp. NPDC051770 TaxID=3155413 RepID=UPI003438AB63
MGGGRHVAVVGVGRIGLPLIQRLVAAGHDVLGNDIRAERRAAVEEAGAVWSPTLPSADVLITVLPGAPELEALVAEGFLARLEPGTLWIDLTSASPELGESIGRAATGISYLECPIGGGVDGMRAGTLTLYAGGSADVLAAAEPILRTFATTIHHTGPHGTGYLTKLLINLLWFGQATLTTEALLLAQRHGQSPERFAELLSGSAGDSAFAQRHLPALLAGNYLPDFGLDRCVEELNAVEHAAEGLPHPVTTAVADLHRAALDHFGPIDGELLGPAWLEHQAGSTLHDPS